jgi:hypothetical protein
MYGTPMVSSAACWLEYKGIKWSGRGRYLKGVPCFFNGGGVEEGLKIDKN